MAIHLEEKATRKRKAPLGAYFLDVNSASELNL